MTTRAHRTFVADLFAQFTHTEPAPTGPVMVDHLTERELTILRYLPTMLKASEISGALFVSVNTVKAHLRAPCTGNSASPTDEKPSIRQGPWDCYESRATLNALAPKLVCTPPRQTIRSAPGR
jgi:hypothetical protein